MSGSRQFWVDEYGQRYEPREKDRESSELARGGQGVVYRTEDENLAVKQPLGEDGLPDVSKNVCGLFRRIRTLPLPKGIPVSMPQAILRDEPGYVMRLVNGAKPFEDFFLSGNRRAEMEKEELPAWLARISDTRLALDLFHYARTGSTRRRLYFLYKCAAILARLHSAGIVYCDISFNNVFAGETVPGECWLIDADNLRFELPAGGHTVFTPKFGAPEVVQRRDASRPRTDCWSFAVLAFWTLTTIHPFIGKKVLDPDAGGGWDAEPSPEGIPDDLDEQAYAGYLPFIDDEDDDSNEYPFGGLHRQLVLTPQLRRLFQETFGSGRLHPHRRPSMAIWALELARAFDLSVVCPACGMSQFAGPETAMCPYCQAPLPPFAMARTGRWRKVLQDGGGESIPLPHRMFHPFSLTLGDSTEYEADFNNGRPVPVRGTNPFPPELSFDSRKTGPNESAGKTGDP